MKEAETKYQRSSDLRQHYNNASNELTACAASLKSHSPAEARAVCERYGRSE